MIGAALSRWTMAYFAAALLSLLGAEAMMMAGFGFPTEALRAPSTLVLVHLVTIGWLSLTMCGALGQFIPVLTGKPLRSDRLPLTILALLVTGLIALVLGFLRLDGSVRFQLPFLTVAALLLGAGIALLIWNFACTLWSARPLGIPARFVAVGLVAIGAAVTFGVIFALVLDQVITTRALLLIHAGALPIHVIAGLGGWLTMTAVGVSYRLLTMFMLTPDIDEARARGAFWCASGALAVTVGGGVAAILGEGTLVTALGTALMLAIAALAMYGRDVLQLYRTRRRRALELNSGMAGVALVNLALSAIFCVVIAAAGRSSEYIAAVIFIFTFGWLSGLMLAQMYKIIAFVTWLEVYGPVLGKIPTPRVQDLVAERPATLLFVLFFAGVWAATGALMAGSVSAFRVATVAMAVATGGIALQMLKTRRLSHVPPAHRHPGEIAQPMLLEVSNQTTQKQRF